MDPIFITVAPNGAKKTKKDHANVPLSPEEIAVEAERCFNAGARMLHLHIRDENARHSLDATIYNRAIDAVRSRVGEKMIIQTTTECGGIYSQDEQIAMVRSVKPEAISVALREFIREKEEDEARACDFFHEVEEAGIQPQYILYSPDEVRYFATLRKQKKLPEGRKFILFVLGKKTGSPFDRESFSVPDDLDPFLETFDEGLSLADTDWATCAFGGNELDCMLKSVTCGGHVRIGFENNLLTAEGSVAHDNGVLISQFVKSLSAVSPRSIFTDADEIRKFLKRK